MSGIRYVYWQNGGLWVGYLEEFPDYMTQGESFEDLQEHLRDLYRDLGSGEPGVRRYERTSSDDIHGMSAAAIIYHDQVAAMSVNIELVVLVLKKFCQRITRGIDRLVAAEFRMDKDRVLRIISHALDSETLYVHRAGKISDLFLNSLLYFGNGMPGPLWTHMFLLDRRQIDHQAAESGLCHLRS